MNTAGVWLPFLLSLPIFLVGGISFFKLRKPQHVNLIRIYLASFALYFGVMPLYGFISEWLSGYWFYDREEVLSAYLCLYIFLGGVLIPMYLYNISPRKFWRGWTLPQLLEKQYRDIPLRQAVKYFLIVIGFLLWFNIFFGFTAYGSSTLQRNLAVPYPLVVIKSLSAIVVCGLVGYGALHLIRGKQYLYLGLLLLCSNNFLNLFSRRTYLLALIVLILFKLIMDRFRVSIRQVLVVGVVGLLVLQVFFPFLYVFRLLTTDDPENKKQKGSLIETYEVSQGNRGYQLEKGLESNEAYRANQIARNIEFMRLPQKEGRYMNGLIFGFQASAVIPRVLNPAKLETGKGLTPEAIILIFYGRKKFDLSDNLPLYGYLEYGFTGVFIVGIFQAILLIIFEWLVFQFQKIHSFLGLSVFMFFLYNHLNLEYPYLQELSSLRETLIFFFIAWPLHLIFRWLAYLRKRPRHNPG